MQTTLRSLMVVALAGVAFSFVLTDRATSQDKKEEKKDAKPANKAAEEFAKRLMAFDKNKDGKLTKDEITDERLLNMFNRADANKDGVVTEAELRALAEREVGDEERGGKGGFEGKGGKGGKGGFEGGKGGKGGFEGKGPPGGRQPGVILSPPLQNLLNLTDKQKEELAVIQKDVDAKLAKLLTEEQKKQLKEIAEGGFGGRGEGGKGKGKGGKGKDD